jgi:hypothetical protein
MSVGVGACPSGPAIHLQGVYEMEKCAKPMLSGVLEMPVEQQERSMDEECSLLAVEQLTFEPHSICGLCKSSPSFLRYEALASEGVCCLACFPRLLRAMKHRKRDATGHTGNAE